MTRGPWRRLLQAGAFVRKEVGDVVHQPRLLASLVLAPFLILLAFGVGYRTQPEPYRAWLVDPGEQDFVPRVREVADQLGSAIRIVGDGTDEADARRRLEEGRVDVVVVFPSDPLESVMKGERAPITILHNRIDPIEQTAIDFASRLAVDVVNSRIVAGVVASGQQAAAPLGRPLAPTLDALAAADADLARGDREAAAQRLDTVASELRGVRIALGLSSSLTSQFGTAEGTTPTTAAAGVDPAAAADEKLAQAADRLDALRSSVRTGDTEASRRDLSALTQDVQGADQGWSALTSVQADVLVRPFVTKLQNVTPGRRALSDFYVPAAVMLLVQQFGVAFGALSFVRERALGIVDVFRVAPVGAAETVVGKYVGYSIVGAGVAAALMALVRLVLRVPMGGRWPDAAIALGLTLVASVGLGLLLSLVASSDSQAVQYTMITLLASLFFSGFFLSTEQLTYPIRSLSWLLPSTYGSRLLRDVMLRGLPLERTVVLGVGAHALVVLVLTIVGTHRRLTGDG